MTRVDFFQVDSNENPLMFTCRLVEKAYRQGCHIYVHTESADHAAELDELLWTFRADRFIPHALLDSGTPAPVHIGCGTDPGEHKDVMINLSGDIPDFFSRFERVTEIVPQEPHKRSEARNNFRFYKDRGYPLKYHDLNKTDNSPE
jgi:DNA polymerase-3 subunit chi